MNGSAKCKTQTEAQFMYVTSLEQSLYLLDEDTVAVLSAMTWPHNV